MKKKHLSIFIAILVFSAVMFVYHSYIRPRFFGPKDVVMVVDDFEKENTRDWYIASMQDDIPVGAEFKVQSGKVYLRKTKDEKDLYLLSRPLKLEKGKVLRVTRSIRLSKGAGYFSGGMAIFQTSSNQKMLNLKAENNKGSALLLVEYISDAPKESKRGSKDGIRLLAPSWEKNGGIKTLPLPAEKEYVEEEILYNSSTGETIYRCGEKKKAFQSVPLTDDYVRLWMHAYGEGTGQYIEVDKVLVEVIEDKASSADE